MTTDPDYGDTLPSHVARSPGSGRLGWRVIFGDATARRWAYYGWEVRPISPAEPLDKPAILP